MEKKRILWGGLLTLVAVIPGSAQEPKARAETEKVKIGPATIEVPTTWERQRPRSEMRALQYSIPKVEGDEGKVEFIVFYFGGQGGGVDENLARWRAMFQDAKDEGKTEKFESSGLKITTLDISGTYKDRPFPASPDVTLREKYRLLAAVVDTPDDGPYFFRIVGPEKSVAAQAEHWTTMLKNATTK